MSKIDVSTLSALRASLSFVAFAWVGSGNLSIVAAEVDYGRDVKPLLTKYCVGCHDGKENESDVQLQSLATIRKGGTNGPLIDSSKPEESRMLQVIMGTLEPKMPPDDSPQPTVQDVETLRQWILFGAKGVDEPVSLKARLNNTKAISAAPSTSLPITSIGLSGNGSLLLGRTNAIYQKTTQWSQPLPIDLVGKVTQVRTTHNGRFTVLASGIPGIGGQATVLSNSSAVHSNQPLAMAANVVRVIEGHRDSLYTAVLNPDGTLLATGGYDRVIHLWDMADGRLLRKLEGHNGAIYDLDFDATGQVLASASADETIKIWRVKDGERLDTFGQCEAEQYSVRFDSARNRVIAAGADKRVRVWKLLSMDVPSVSPMIYSVFAHEAPVLYTALSADGELLATAGEDKFVKLWRVEDLSPLGQLGELLDAPSGLVWDTDQRTLIASTLAGDLLRLKVPADLGGLRVQDSLASVKPHRVAQVTALPAVVKLEGISTKTTARDPMVVSVNSEVSASLSSQDMQGDQAGDWYVFSAKQNETWIVQVDAKGSPMDSQLDILDRNGSQIVRTRLQAIRETYFTFRGKDSMIADDFRLHRWEDMELNELLYAGGEVVKLWLYPRGPDSGFKLFPGFGKRFTYFDTTATTHALNEPAWIVRELAPNAPPLDNGLPVFPIYFSNDDDANRLEGVNSKISFTAPSDGEYLVRVRDTRGQSGDNYKYRLAIRSPMPSFQFRLEQKEITLRPGVGTEFSVVVDRLEGCDGEISIQLDGLPEGIQWTKPLAVEAGQHKAVGQLVAPADVSKLAKEFKLIVTCKTRVGDLEIDGGVGQELVVKVNEKLTMPLKVVALEHDASAAPLSELVLHPGQTATVKLIIERGENLGDIAFGGDDSGRNLPHGCFVDNIGLSGLLIPAGQSTREVFITVAPWVSEQNRPFHLRANVDGNPTTTPILLRIQRKSERQLEKHP